MLRTAALALMLLSNLTCAQAVKSFTGAIFAAPAQSTTDSTYLSGVETTLNAAADSSEAGRKVRQAGSHPLAQRRPRYGAGRFRPST